MEDVLKLHLELIVEIPSEWFVGSASYVELEHLNMRFFPFDTEISFRLSL